MRMLLSLIGLAVLVVGLYWAGYYVNFANDPNDRFGSELTRWMPEPVRLWGCDKLSERFPNNRAPNCGRGPSV